MSTAFKEQISAFYIRGQKVFYYWDKNLKHRIRARKKSCEVERGGNKFLLWWGFSYHRIYSSQVVEGLLNAQAYIVVLQRRLEKTMVSNVLNLR